MGKFGIDKIEPELDFNILVNAKKQDGRFHITLTQLNNENTIALKYHELAHILTSGVCLLIKLANQTSEKKDYELLKEVITHLESEFISIDSFSDAKDILK